MNKKIHSVMMLTLLLIGMLTLAFNIQAVESDWIWTETIYIRADGSIDPDTAPISTADNITYTLTDNIIGDIPRDSNVIVVERDNIVVDGAGYTLQASGYARAGISLSERNNVTIRNMEIKNSFVWGHACILSQSSNNTISGNNITNTEYGIQLWYSSDNNISANNITNNGYGIFLYRSSNNTVVGNTFANDGLFVTDYSYSNLVEGNLVNGKPLVFLEEVSDYAVSDAGQIVLVKCNNIQVENLNLSRTDVALELWETNNTTVSNNNITNNERVGIYLFDSGNNSIFSNNIPNNYVIAIVLHWSSNNNMIRGNNITNNGDGILCSSNSNMISENNITNNNNGITLWGSSGNKVSGNNIATNTYNGVTLNGFSKNNTISGNNVINNNRYGINLFMSSNNRVSRNNITGNGRGVLLEASSDNNTLGGNNLANNNYGICLEGVVTDRFTWRPENNVIYENNIADNKEAGVRFGSCLNNIFYHNNFLNNTAKPVTDELANIWDDGYPSGGNYWNDYEEKYPDAEELDGSGIWNTPYVIDANNQDNYPLMEPWTPTPPIPTTIDELKTKIEKLGSVGEIDNRGIVKALLAKLNVAQKLVDKGKIDQAKSILEEDFIPQVQNLTDIHITPEAADTLIESAEYIISHL